MTIFLKTLLILGLTVVDCLSAFFNLTALMGYACKKSTFLLPNLFMQMFNLIIGLLVLSGLCVLSGFVHLLSCAVLSGLTLIIGGWMIYYWIVLFKAYQRVSKSLWGQSGRSLTSWKSFVMTLSRKSPILRDVLRTRPTRCSGLPPSWRVMSTSELSRTPRAQPSQSCISKNTHNSWLSSVRS